MSITMNPYLNFDGTAGKALELYERVFGAKAEISRYGDPEGAQIPAEHKDRVMHARILVGGAPLMVSDTPPGHPPARGSNVHVCLQLNDIAEARAKFEALSQGGQVTMPLQDTFWGATFGMLVDAYGIPWMFNCEKEA